MAPILIVHPVRAQPWGRRWSAAAKRLVLVVACAFSLSVAAALPTGHALAQSLALDPSLCGGALFAVFATDGQPTLSLELAATEAQREYGLMYRQSLDANSGMLFQFDNLSQDSFWMRDTYIPLSIAWLGRDGTIVDIQDMQPLSDDIHTPKAPYWFAVEANQGWFAMNGVSVGQQMLLCPPIVN